MPVTAGKPKAQRGMPLAGNSAPPSIVLLSMMMGTAILHRVVLR